MPRGESLVKCGTNVLPDFMGTKGSRMVKEEGKKKALGMAEVCLASIVIKGVTQVTKG